MKFVGLCLITENVPRLVEFYSKVLDTVFSGDATHSEARVDGAYFAIYSREASSRQLGFELREIKGNGNVTLMFEVGDVDREFQRVSPYVQDVLSEPKTHPWGARAFHFRDPDGNMVDFFKPREEG